MKNLVVHTQNKGTYIDGNGATCKKVNPRFGEYYFGEYDNTDRLTIVGVPSEEDGSLRVGIAFCTYPDNFSRHDGILRATAKAENSPYVIMYPEDFSLESCLERLYKIHDSLIKLSVKEVKKLVAKQIVK